MMNRGGLAVDISLLAVLIALHATRKNKNLELVVMALLFSHIIMTTEAFGFEDEAEELDGEDGVDGVDEQEGLEPGEVENVENVELDKDEVSDEVSALGATRTSVKISETTQDQRKSVSDGEFDRMAFAARTSSNVPREANLELAKSRSSFFEELFPNK